MFDTYYPYKKMMHTKVGDQLVTYLFKFKADKKRIILVEIEYHKEHPIAIIKFYEKTFRNSDKRFNMLTGSGKFLPILRTCLNIMIDLYHENPYISFGFCGAPTPKEIKAKETGNSKRFRIYRYIMANMFSNLEFQHLAVDSCNLYFLINRHYCDSDPKRQGQILQQIKEIYPQENFWNEPVINNIIEM